jgi:serine/threonine protein kinase
MSPEQLSVREELTKASDVYSMAVLAYEMTTGRRPFKASSGAELFDLQQQGIRAMPSDLCPDVDSEAQAVMLKGLSFKASERYQDANVFGTTLEQVLKESRRNSKPGVNRSRKYLVIGLVVLITLAALSTFAIYHYRKTTTSKAATTHSFKYWLMVQRMRDGTAYQNPDKSNGQEIFGKGDKFQINISSEEPAYIYVFHESQPEPNNNSFTVAYPIATVNSGSATIGVNQVLQTDWITFSGPAGSQNVWIVWSTSPVSELEKAKNESFSNKDRALTGETLVATKTFLTTKEAETKPKITRYKASQIATVRGASDMLVILVGLEHR